MSKKSCAHEENTCAISQTDRAMENLMTFYVLTPANKRESAFLTTTYDTPDKNTR